MSQYKKQQGDLEILYGWDKPLNYYFLVVELNGELPAALVWSNLNLQIPGLTIRELLRILEGFGIRLTTEELQELLGDSDHRIGEQPWGSRGVSKGAS